MALLSITDHRRHLVDNLNPAAAASARSPSRT
jgi:hypothetical protein